ncbi:hypothetical protein [Streptomyces europaeiscabiei]|uniref:hypothetical protein n=1 Tax=Streptomyces europaeiscabiei TaxID=146819 RepID=UPI002E2A8F76|nr:hypothetical protein [Streptomyces europaeiscabiei]
MLPPRVYAPGAAEEALEPRSVAAGTYDLIEYVPLGEAEAFAGAKVTCTKLRGPCQRQVELLRVGRGVSRPRGAAAERCAPCP